MWRAFKITLGVLFALVLSYVFFWGSIIVLAYWTAKHM